MADAKLWTFDFRGRVIEVPDCDRDLFDVYESRERAAVVALDYLRLMLDADHELVEQAEARRSETLNRILALRREFAGL